MALRIPDDKLYQLLRAEKISDFNQQRGDQALDFHDCDFRGLDLRNLLANNINFKGCYFRNADLRGIDFREASLEGASIAHAKISGCYFPNDFSADEIRLSQEFGTRLRVRAD